MKAFPPFDEAFDEFEKQHFDGTFDSDHVHLLLLFPRIPNTFLRSFGGVEDDEPRMTNSA